MAAATLRQRVEGELLRTRDLALLAWLVEQYGARADQLEVLLGCGRRTVERTLERMRGAGLVETRRLLVGQPPWVLPTTAGLRASRLGFGTWRPRPALIAHVAAVNDVRLHIMQRSPESEWLCERGLARDRAADEHLPDAIALTDERRVAIEVELTVKSQRRVTAIVEELCARFDAVVYFCAPSPLRVLRELESSGRCPSLAVRELPRPAMEGSLL